MIDPIYCLDHIDSPKSNLCHGPANSMCIVNIVFISVKYLENFTSLAVLFCKCFVSSVGFFGFRNT